MYIITILSSQVFLQVSKRVQNICTTRTLEETFKLKETLLESYQILPSHIVTPGVRESAKYSYDQDWLRQGYMARLCFLPDDPISSHKAQIMAATHSLTSDMHNAISCLSATRSKIHALTTYVYSAQFWKILSPYFINSAQSWKSYPLTL